MRINGIITWILLFKIVSGIAVQIAQGKLFFGRVHSLSPNSVVWHPIGYRQGCNRTTRIKANRMHGKRTKYVRLNVLIELAANCLPVAGLVPNQFYVCLFFCVCVCTLCSVPGETNASPSRRQNNNAIIADQNHTPDFRVSSKTIITFDTRIVWADFDEGACVRAIERHTEHNRWIYSTACDSVTVAVAVAATEYTQLIIDATIPVLNFPHNKICKL